MVLFIPVGTFLLLGPNFSSFFLSKASFPPPPVFSPPFPSPQRALPQGGQVLWGSPHVPSTEFGVIIEKIFRKARLLARLNWGFFLGVINGSRFSESKQRAPSLFFLEFHPVHKDPLNIHSQFQVFPSKSGVEGLTVGVFQGPLSLLPTPFPRNGGHPTIRSRKSFRWFDT